MGVIWIESSDGTVETAMKNVARAVEDSKALDFLPPPDNTDYTDPAVRDQKAAAETALRGMAGPKGFVGLVAWCLKGGPIKAFSAFCGAIVRALDAILSTMNQALRRIRALEATDTTVRLETAEKQLEILCDEHRELRKQVKEIERRDKPAK